MRSLAAFVRDVTTGHTDDVPPSVSEGLPEYQHTDCDRDTATGTTVGKAAGKLRIVLVTRSTSPVCYRHIPSSKPRFLREDLLSYLG